MQGLLTYDQERHEENVKECVASVNGAVSIYELMDKQAQV